MKKYQTEKEYRAERARNKHNFEEDIKEGSLIEVGRFNNDVGEEFVVARMNIKSILMYIVTGDEFDWDTNYFYSRHLKNPIQEFFLASDERKNIEELIEEDKNSNPELIEQANIVK